MWLENLFRKWQPSQVFLPGESQRRGSLVGCCLWGRTESDMTEATLQQQKIYLRKSTNSTSSHGIILRSEIILIILKKCSSIVRKEKKKVSYALIILSL